MSNNPYFLKKEGVVCTRYAPSPTGNLHIGGARTALFNYLIAKRYGGRFILRIEDTDEERNIEDGHKLIENDLKFLNIFPDESFSLPGPRGPYLQSQKLDRYEDLCKKLLEEGKAYRCFCTESELEEARQSALKNNSTPIYSKKCRLLSQEQIETKLNDGTPFAVRLKIDGREKYEWEDLLRGPISIPSNSISDPIIVRSNGRPTYNFAVVVDDHDMEINCVLRGEEHISNTPSQLAVYHALGWEDSIPAFGHLSIIVDKDKKKLSKRASDPNHFISGLMAKGYPPEAVLNFLVLLGWSHGEEEIFSQEKLVEIFNLEAMSKAPAFYDIEKLNWISHKYFQEMSSSYYLNFVSPFFDQDLGEHNSRRSLFALATKNSISFAGQLNEMAREFFEKKTLNEKQIEFLREKVNLLILARDYFPKPGEDWNNITIRNYLKQLMQLSDMKGKEFFKPLRTVFSYMDEGFELVNVIECLGRDVVFSNLTVALSLVNA